ncbi:RNA polymerase sigma factor (sigma-70 family) [Murinocardiopsis flavida]|uniref:RNA polymerase sigma factor n=1 Tax=Murinocardiopsis flavida TaxID=645275 RepID=A0A2P8DRY0_9ACTN|nr:sigma-70 family RNA polymerase sigma factor [Murinocardiopsis flavida]PSK99944.1 RNA polymerase sigma factor (sigma-70 family) [Murinocardiopsis flavida]
MESTRSTPPNPCPPGPPGDPHTAAERPRPPRGCAADESELTSLALAARDGAADALERLIAATRGDVARFIGRMTDPQSVEELTQETYIRAMRGLSRYAARSSARTWLLAIARHTVVDRYRAIAARPKTTALAAEDAPRGRIPGAAARIDEQVALMDLLARLDEPRRRAFVLTQVEDYSYAEVAAMVAAPLGTVRSRVARARGDLVRALRAAESPERAEPRRLRSDRAAEPPERAESRRLPALSEPAVESAERAESRRLPLESAAEPGERAEPRRLPLSPEPVAERAATPAGLRTEHRARRTRPDRHRRGAA